MNAQQEQPAIERVTNAPEEYDGFGTTTVEWLPWKSLGQWGKQYRVVRIPDAAQFGDWQKNRYSSGSHPCISRETFQEWVDLKLGIEPTPVAESAGG